MTPVFVCNVLSAKNNSNSCLSQRLCFPFCTCSIELYCSLKRVVFRLSDVKFEFRIVSIYQCACSALLHIESIRCSPDTTGSREEVTPNLLFAFYQCHVSPRDLWISQRVGVIINQRNPFFTCDRAGRRRYSAIENPLRGIVDRRRIEEIKYLHSVFYLMRMWVCVCVNLTIINPLRCALLALGVEWKCSGTAPVVGTSINYRY